MIEDGKPNTGILEDEYDGMDMTMWLHTYIKDHLY